ncbi:MAG: pyridoxamine kinase [Clostridia bacterium]|nr:pyridoxamine kinase [Clostridia bacterium]
MRQKRIAAIHDISGIGKCSLTVALPIISVAGIECAAMPTALLSTHTGGFKNIYIEDLTKGIMPIANHWKNEGFEFDAIYSGYLGSMEQVDLIKNCISVLKGDKTLVVVDPVMGDNGRLYQSFSPEFAFKMRELCAVADIITPNVTEACLMLSEDYKAPPYTKRYIEELLLKLSEICSGTIVLTGACLSENEQGAAAYNSKNGKISFISCPRMAGIYHGTGDVFASTFVSGMVLEKGMEKSLKAAVEFTKLAIENTKENLPELWYGVNFEGVLPKLPKLLED